MTYKLGIIGGGALAESIIRGICGKTFAASDIFVAECRKSRCEELSERFGVKTSLEADFLNEIGLLIVAVKPKDAKNVFSSLKNRISPSTIVSYTVAGLKLAEVEQFLPENAIVRLMPNVAVSVGESMTAFAPNSRVFDGAKDIIRQFWSNLGRVIEIDEVFMDAVTGLSGSSPAFAFLVIDSLADGGVAAGLPRKMAIELSAQTIFGAAKMVLTGEHPDILRDKVTSPAGTTIEGIRVLERGAIRSHFIEAVLAAAEKSKSM